LLAALRGDAAHELLRHDRHRRGDLPRRPAADHVQHPDARARDAGDRHSAPAHSDRDGRERPRQRDQDAGAVVPARRGDEVVLARQQGRGGFRRGLLEARVEAVAGVDWLLTRETVITLAILAAVLSVASSVLQVKQIISVARARQLNVAGYTLM